MRKLSIEEAVAMLVTIEQRAYEIYGALKTLSAQGYDGSVEITSYSFSVGGFSRLRSDAVKEKE